MEFSKIACALALCLSTNVLAVDAEPQAIDAVNYAKTTENIDASATVNLVEPVSMSIVGGWIIGAAKSAVTNGVKSLLKDALFGSSGPNYVLLHADALQQIEDIVTEVVLTSDVENAKSLLKSFESMIQYYNATAQGQNPDHTILPQLISFATSLKHHQAYTTSYNPNAYLLTGSYSLVSALTLAVFTEKELQGAVSHAYVKSVADTLHTSLTGLGAQANGYISSNVYLRHPTGNCDNIIILGKGDSKEANTYTQDNTVNENEFLDGPGYAAEYINRRGNDCSYYVFDKIGQQNSRYSIALHGRTLAQRLAYKKKNALVAQYQDKIKGADYSAIVNGLATY